MLNQLKHPEQLAKILLILALIFAGAIFAYFHVKTLLFPYPLDYQEGPLLDQVVRLEQGENIYRPDYKQPPFVVADSPPMFLLTNIPFEKLFGPAYWYGRLISGLSVIAAAVFMGLTIHSLTDDYWGALAAGISLLAFPLIRSWSSLVRIDALALGLSRAGLFLVIQGKGKTRFLVVAVILLTGAVYTRQTYILAAPAAAFIWLWSNNLRRQSILFGGMFFALVVGTLLLFNVASSSGFFYGVVTALSGQTFILADIPHWFKQHILEIAPYSLLIAAAYIIVGIRSAKPMYWFVVVYLAGAVVDALTIGKAGSNINYFFELAAALSLIIGLVIASQKQQHTRLKSLLIATVAIQIGFAAAHGLRTPDEIMSRLPEKDNIQKLDELIAATPGKILLDEYTGLMPPQGREIYIEPFQIMEMYQKGEWDDKPLLKAVQECEFSLIVLYDQKGEALIISRWPQDVLDAIEVNYEMSQSLAGNRIYTPRCST